MSYNPELYIHDMDKRAFDALNAFPAFSKLCEIYDASIDEKAEKIEFMSKAVRLGKDQMPDIYDLLPPICDKLEIDIPELYYVKSDDLNAATSGTINPYIYISSGLVERIPDELLGTVLARECGHIACKHSLYRNIAMLLMKGVDSEPLAKIPEIKRCASPALVKTMMLWSRCSELSADRAAILCDGGYEKSIDLLLRLNGYEDGIDREAFMEQSLDLCNYVDEDRINKTIEIMVTNEETHPRLAMRACECHEWYKSEQYRGIVAGTYTLKDKQEECISKVERKDAVEAEVTLKYEGREINESQVTEALEKVNTKLERYTNNATKMDYALAISSGILAGVVDSVYVGKLSITQEDIKLSHDQVDQFVQRFAENKGIDDKSRAILGLEKKYVVAQDNTWSGKKIQVSATNHHLADLAHHPTPVGLVAAIVVRFLRIGTFVNKEGEWHFKFVKTELKDIIDAAIPAVLTGFLNWLVMIAEKNYEAETDEKIPEVIDKLAHIVASTPIIIEIAKCADNWFGHLVSDMGGSSTSKAKGRDGMGIPGLLLSMLHEISGLPGLKDSGLPQVINNLYEKEKIDLRFEMNLYRELKRQAIPVILNEVFVRIGYFISRLCNEFKEKKSIKEFDWKKIVPFGNRTVDRMLLVASMTFNVADIADAAVRAAIESKGNWVVFAGKIVCRYNYVGMGRTALAIVKEVSNEKKEAQLIHEKMILTEMKTAFVITRLEEYKDELEQRLSDFLAEDLTLVIEGFEDIKEGLAKEDSDQVIKGNVKIQKVLGREPQFTSQKEFDDLMASSDAFVF